MCGICVVFDQSGAPVDPDLLARMTASLEHRGPDGEGRVIDCELGLGHRRLSIIDVDGGAQPLGNEDGSLQIVLNGEVYNFLELRVQLESLGHRFKTQSDTEVVVHAYEQWGPDCVHRLIGIFAFAVWDTRSRRLFLARDHIGVKPLYYVRIGHTLVFASEIKALLQVPGCPREVDLQSLAEFFTFRFVPSPKTLFRGIFKIPPGHRVAVSRDGMQVERYWTWTPLQRGRLDERVVVEEYRSLLEDAVRLQLRSDVPVGLFLSSGVDSALLLALMAAHSAKPVTTFTIGFEGGEENNELSDAAKLAQMFGASHDFAMLSPGDYESYYERYLWDLEEPVGNETAAAFYFLSRMTSQSVKVALTGQGADEPWAGYDRYIGAKLSSYYSRLPTSLTSSLAALVALLPGRHERLSRGIRSLGEKDELTRFAKIYSFFSDEMKDALFTEHIQAELRATGHQSKEALRRLHADVAHLDPLSQMLYIDTRASLPDDLLMVCDKMSMANGLEVRVPYLDHRVVEFVESLPPSMKLNGLTAKHLHKRAAEKWLPRTIVWRKKKGFANPVEQWFRDGMRPFVEDCLLSSSSAAGKFFDRATLRTILQRDREGREQLRRHIYLLVSFELWHRRFIAH